MIKWNLDIELEMSLERHSILAEDRLRETSILASIRGVPLP